MKGKYIMIFSMGFTAMIFMAIMFTQFKTVEHTDIAEIETMRESELRTELSSYKTKNEEIEIKLKETKEKIEEYKQQIENNKDASILLEKEIADAEKYIGYTEVGGEGIVITLSDNEIAKIRSSEIIKLINELRVAGAEAISINEERVVFTTDIAGINDDAFIAVNTAERYFSKLVSPYVVKAIGNKKYLESAITIKGGFIDEIRAVDKTISYETSDSIIIPKYEGTIEINNAE